MFGKIIVIAFLVVGLTSCSSKEEPPPPSTQTPGETVPFATLPSTRGAGTPSISSNAPVIIPDNVKGKWKAVILLVEDKQDNSSKDYRIKIGSELKIPDSEMNISIIEFLPDLKIEGSTFTSASNELLNPSVHVKITESGQEVFDGWLFQLFPAVHPFSHDRFNIVLREPISK